MGMPRYHTPKILGTQRISGPGDQRSSRSWSFREGTSGNTMESPRQMGCPPSPTVPMEENISSKDMLVRLWERDGFDAAGGNVNC